MTDPKLLHEIRAAEERITGKRYCLSCRTNQPTFTGRKCPTCVARVRTVADLKSTRESPTSRAILPIRREK